MKPRTCALTVLLAGALALTGCGKSGNPQPSAAATLMDISKLQQSFPSPTPEVQTSLDKFRLAESKPDGNGGEVSLYVGSELAIV